MQGVERIADRIPQRLWHVSHKYIRRRLSRIFLKIAACITKIKAHFPYGNKRRKHGNQASKCKYLYCHY